MDTPSPVNAVDAVEPRFYDNFLQDRNIKWILGIGTAILLGSSLMLVSSQWSGYSALFKEIVILAYTGGIYAIGKYGYERLALRHTGTVLLTLAVLLAPIACAALPWVWETESWNVLYSVLLLAGGLLTARIGSRTFEHFLRQKQPSLTAAYVLLSLAGAVVPISAKLHSPWVALALWCVFAVGTIKVNRSVFWLLEEQQRPRVFGFFPMLLLGLQFLGLFVAYFAGATAVDWIGFGCLLTAVPILTAADAVARVFQQRTGNLVRPLPWSILTPLAAGLALSATGVVLSGVQLFDGTPYALVPTSAIAAGLMLCVARRTERREFVYAALVLTTVAYRFLPVFFAEATRLVIQATAEAIHEPRLPWAYYGFTFVPLSAALIAASRWAGRRGSLLFAEPTKHFAIGLSLAFLALAPTHEKALFPAAATLCAVFAAEAAVFRHRLLALPAIAAWLLAAAGMPYFVNGVFAAPLSPSAWFVCELAAAALLLLPGAWIDRLLVRLPEQSGVRRLPAAIQSLLRQPCRYGSLLMTALLMVAWVIGYGLRILPVPGLPAAAALAGLAIAHAVVARRRGLGVGALLFANVVIGTTLAELAMTEVLEVSFITAMFLGQWIASYLLAARPQWRVSQAFAGPMRYCSLVLLTLSFGLFYLPVQLWQTVLANLTWESPLVMAAAAMLVWLADAARREKSRILGGLAVIGPFVAAGALLRTVAPALWPWLPMTWVVVAAAWFPVAMLLRRYGRAWSAVLDPAEVIVPWVLGAVAVTSLAFFTTPMLAAGTAAAIVLAAWMAHGQHPLRIQLPLVLLNWRLIGFVAAFLRPEASHFLELGNAGILVLCLPMAAACGLSALAWTWVARPDEKSTFVDGRELIGLHGFALRLLTSYLLVLSTQLPALGIAGVIAAVAAFGSLLAAELLVGCRHNDEGRIWIAQAIAGLAVGYFAWFHVIQFGRGVSMFVVLAVGLVLSLVGHLAQRRPAIAALARPFLLSGRALPMVTVLIGVGRHIAIDPRWLGWNSLALLAAAAFYFHRGLAVREKRWFVLALGILNVAVALLWRELRLSDPQFYMIPIGITVLALVELLEREIPEAYRDPLRYAGALMILVSPTFHIVAGSWLHLLSLMVASVLVILAAIGLRVRALVYTGTAFLAADIAAMVIRGSIDHPQLLWAAGLAFGAGLLALGAACELKRERVLQQVRAVGAALEAFK